MSEVFRRLKTEFPGVKLLALGQTVYWDEPMKAILQRRLNEQYPECRMIIGIHDADYFSKVPSTLDLHGWGILPHNDGSTKDLWAATGEISALFGSETIPTREQLAANGVRLDKIAKDFPAGRAALMDMATEAWGWRGLVHTDAGTEIACCIPLEDSLPHLIELLEWGFHHTLDALSVVDSTRGRRVADELIAEVRDYADSHPDDSITDMFRDFLVRFYERFLGTSENLEVSGASRLFTFNRSTAGLPRFNLLGAFLNPETRAACQEAYDLAVRGSDTYTLDRFPPGAIPFDLVVPRKGRGTICLRDNHVVIDMEEPITLPGETLPTTPGALASLIEDHFGPEVALVGKALTLVLMMAREFVFVLHEQASAYVPRCRKMAALMKERGVNLPFLPILRVNYHTWDCLSACDATFSLPGHLAAAFRQGEITSREFADSWQSTVREQEELLKRIAATTSLDELLAFLIEQQADPWRERIETHMNAYATVLDLSEKARPLKEESVRLRDLSHQIKQEVQQLEIEKGEHFREKVKPLKDEMDRIALEGKNDAAILQELRSQEELRAELEKQIEAKREEANQAHNRSLQLKHEVRSLENGEEAVNARRAVDLIEYEAELARLWLVRDAILVSQGLTYTNHRPSAWWFLMADPELKWFNAVASTAEFRFEEMS
ncbi:MAG TPA: hypothetical protein VFI02_18350 [Armatimonadota bacterium]|nr:hypothetical protein [Armatimonadota bacterium]